MGRALPPACPPIPPRRAILENSQYDVLVVTPLFGGGVSPREFDKSMPIRPSSIRGHLRFWWRATAGAKLTLVDDLREREATVWGSTEMRSAVEVCVRDVAGGPKFPPNGRKLKYALFPFVADTQGTPESPGITGIKFKLGIRCPTGLRDEVDAALRAWMNFGGIGARTRRGCGALYCEALALRNREEALRAFPRGGASSGWPVLGDVLVSDIPERPLEAWKRVIELMRNFRQGEYGREGTIRDPHRSKWPEADTLRRITRSFLVSGHPPKAGGHDAFPRAELGLPIQFKFTKDGGDEANNSELLPINDRNEELTRMASPIILRPLAVSADRAFGMVVRLNTPELKQAKLKALQIKGRPSVSPQLNRIVPGSEIQNLAAAFVPGSPLAGHASAVDAFFSYCEGRL